MMLKHYRYKDFIFVQQALVRFSYLQPTLLVTSYPNNVQQKRCTFNGKKTALDDPFNR